MRRYFIKKNNYIIGGIMHEESEKNKASNNMKFQVYGLFHSSQKYLFQFSILLELFHR